MHCSSVDHLSNQSLSQEVPMELFKSEQTREFLILSVDVLFFCRSSMKSLGQSMKKMYTLCIAKQRQPGKSLRCTVGALLVTEVHVPNQSISQEKVNMDRLESYCF